jgi:hypothetical protein
MSVNKFNIDEILEADNIIRNKESKRSLINYLKVSINNGKIDKRIKCARIEFISKESENSYKNVQGHIFRGQNCSISVLCKYVKIIKENLEKYPFLIK